MAEVTSALLSTLNTSVNMAFNNFLQAAPSQYGRIAMTVGSTSRENFYPKLDEIPGLREWIGERVVHSLSSSAYAIRNRTFELTLGIDREDLEDDNYGLFNIGIAQLGNEAGVLPDKLSFGLLAAGTSTLCYDGQNYFDTDHVSYTAAGTPVVYANTSSAQAGETDGPPWYLFDTSKPLKPLIFQTRRAFTITARTQLDMDNVFRTRRFEWGTDGRCNVGFGLWQTAFRSTRPLTPQAYADARAAMGSIRRLDGAPLGLTPDLLIVPSALEGAGLALAKNEFVSAIGANGQLSPVSNQWRGTVEALKSPWL